MRASLSPNKNSTAFDKPYRLENLKRNYYLIMFQHEYEARSMAYRFFLLKLKFPTHLPDLMNDDAHMTEHGHSPKIFSFLDDGCSSKCVQVVR